MALIDALVPHHQTALEMANVAFVRSENSKIIEMATMMRDAQSAEIAQMRRIREELVGDAETPTPDDEHVSDDLAELKSLSGPDFDRAFLHHMIAHHSSAISMSHRALPFLETAEILELARKTVINQAKESGEMAEMLEGMGGP